MAKQMYENDNNKEIAVVKSVISPTNFIASIGKISLLLEFKEFEKRLTNYCEGIHATKTPGGNNGTYVYQAVLVRINDDSSISVWKRAKIAKIEVNYLTVFLTDECEVRDFVKFNDIITDLPDDYYEFDSNAQRCRLKNAVSINPRNPDEWSGEACDYFRNLALDLSTLTLASKQIYKSVTNCVREVVNIFEIDPFYLDKADPREEPKKVYLLQNLISRGYAKPLQIVDVTDDEIIGNKNEIQLHSDGDDIELIEGGSSSRDSNYQFVYSTKTQSNQSSKHSTASTYRNDNVIVVDDEGVNQNNDDGDDEEDYNFNQNNRQNKTVTSSSSVVISKNSNMRRNKTNNTNNSHKRQKSPSANSYYNDYRMFFDDNSNILNSIKPTEYICSDETISHAGGYRANVEFNPDVKSLRSVLYGSNFDRNSNITPTHSYAANPDVVKYIQNRTYDILGDKGLNEGSNQKAADIIRLYKNNSENGLVILNCLLEQIDSSFDSIDSVIQIIKIVSRECDMFMRYPIVKGLDFLKEKYANCEVNGLSQASYERFCKIIARLYNRLCLDQITMCDTLNNVKPYCIELLEEWIKIYSCIEKPMHYYMQCYKCVLEFLKHSIEQLKHFNHDVFESIFETARLHNNDAKIHASIKKQCQLIVELYGRNFVKCPSTFAADQLNNNNYNSNQIIIRNENSMIKNGKRKNNFLDAFMN